MSAGTPLRYKAVVVDRAGRTASALADTTAGQPPAPEKPTAVDRDHAVVHYKRPDGDYDGVRLKSGDTSAEFVGRDAYGAFAWVKVPDGASSVTYTIEKAGVRFSTILSLAPKIGFPANQSANYSRLALILWLYIGGLEKYEHTVTPKDHTSDEWKHPRPFQTSGARVGRLWTRILLYPCDITGLVSNIHALDRGSPYSCPSHQSSQLERGSQD